ncbi:HoxN/HupN/NixA family nickel/cobalt transporter [hydrothermal vent metagenome]|uniref:HoxN/HupN/NixA family nickel/cobalt transporter n=1 Tax=hydrothermal vent metagenome TaxID=652676 RepID=A0A3B0SYT4_9ZZZZ
MTGTEWALLGASYLLGLRHGFDWDHIAAITDITSSQDNAKSGLWYSTLYALGHGFVVIVLGAILILSGFAVPDSVETVMERFVGATLVFLGIWVFVSLARHGAEFRLRSRWMLMFQWVHRMKLRVRAWLRRRRGATEEIPEVQKGADEPFANYGVKTSFGVGMLHGVGAETPTQVLIFLAAADTGGRGIGLATLVVFVAGIVTMNTLIAVGSVFGFIGATHSKAIYLATGVIIGVFSLGIGGLFLFGISDVLPALN